MKISALHIVLLCITTAASVYAGESGRKEIGRTTEKEVNVVLSTSFGKVTIEKGEPEKILIAEAYSNDATAPMSVNYDIRNRIGYVDLSLGEGEISGDHKKGAFKISGLDGGTWNLRFSTAIPVSFDVELGVAKGRFDLSGLLVKDFKLSTGASDVVLTFDAPNTSTIDQMSIESGVGKFEGRNLGNANFKSFKFDGGVGTATLDFSGSIRNEVDIDVQVGMGLCTIIIPANVGARVFFEESLVSKIDCGSSFRTSGENQYVSENYKRAASHMNVRIDAGLGKVNIRQR